MSRNSIMIKKELSYLKDLSSAKGVINKETVYVSVEDCEYKFPVIVINDNPDLVVKIGTKYYMRSSKLITRIGGLHYRIKSPLIVEVLQSGSYELKKNCVKMYDGNWALKSLVSTLSGGEFGLVGFNSFYYADVAYANTDSDFILIEEMYHKISSCNTLDVDTYKKTIIYPKALSSKCFVSDKILKTRDLLEVFDVINIQGDTRRLLVSRFNYNKISVSQVIKGIEIRDPRVPIRYLFLNCINCETNKNLTFSKLFNSFVLKSNLKKITSDYKSRLVNEKYKEKTSELKKNISPGKKLSQLDFSKEELVSKEIEVIKGDISGGDVYYKPSKNASVMAFSQSRMLTGGKNYTFGIEHESCAGIFPDYLSERYGLSRVGDGSTRFDHLDRHLHYEYVTSVLNGDLGINKMYEYLPLLGKKILQNNKCSTHIHIGGSASGRLSTQIPIFNREFSARAILLGAQIEDSLMKLLPSSRDVNINRYCSSIRSFKNSNISNKNSINRLIANYVFSNRSLNSGYNSKTRLNRWAPGRYKWLNLVNCNSDNSRRREDGGFSTIEFRIFPPSTNPKKVHFWILICQAFVWFIENRGLMINNNNLTIEDVLKEAYHGKEIYKFVLDCVEKSKGTGFYRREQTKKTEKDIDTIAEALRLSFL